MSRSAERHVGRTCWVGVITVVLTGTLAPLTATGDDTPVLPIVAPVLSIVAPVLAISFADADLKSNLVALIEALNKAKPATSKGIYLRKVSLSSTMGAGVRVDQTTLAA